MYNNDLNNKTSLKFDGDPHFNEFTSNRINHIDYYDDGIINFMVDNNVWMHVKCTYGKAE